MHLADACQERGTRPLVDVHINTKGGWGYILDGLTIGGMFGVPKIDVDGNDLMSHFINKARLANP